MKKTYLLDTNVLLSDPTCLGKFQDNDLVIPVVVLEELDRHKSRSDEVGRNCREISRVLDDLAKNGSLKEGVELQGGGILKVLLAEGDIKTNLPPELSYATSVDNMIIGFAMMNPDCILVTKDINVRVKCSSLGIAAQDYLSIRVSDDLGDLYTGVKNVLVDGTLIDDFYDGKTIEAKQVNDGDCFPNEVFVMSAIGNPSKSAISRSSGGVLEHVKKFDAVFGLKARNKEQTFALDLLMDPSIKLVTLVGKAGSGKTCLAIAAGLEQLDSLGSLKTYQKLLVSRPVQPLGKDIGFLPGTLIEKMDPWIAPIRDNLEFLLGSTSNKKQGKRKQDEQADNGFKNEYLDIMRQKGLIEIEAMSYIRGRSIPNTYMIIDEAQNLSMHELKTIITRVGEGTKIVLTGDIEQIDRCDLDSFTNGLTYAIEKFKEHDIAGHITLVRGERSELATLASKIL